MNEVKPAAGEPQGSAPAAVAEIPERPDQVEEEGSRPEGNEESTTRRGGPDPFYAQKRVQAKLEKRLERLEAQNEELLTALRGQTVAPQNHPPVSTPATLWDNPDKYVSEVTGRQVKAAMLERDRNEAEQYILSQEFIDPERDQEWLTDLADESGAKELAKIDPWKAARMLVMLAKAERGSGERRVSRATARSVAASPAAPQNDGIFSKKAIRAMSMADFEKNRDAILTAAKEGRLKD